MSDLVRQLVISAAFEIQCRGPTFNTPEAMLSWEILREHASIAEISELNERESVGYEEAIRLMAQSDANALGSANEPAFDDAVEVWEELDDEEDQFTIRAIKRMGDQSRKIYRDEWRRIRAGFRTLVR